MFLGVADCTVARPVAAAGMFAWGHHVDAHRQPFRIARGDRIAAAAVDDQRVRQMLGADVRGEPVEIKRFCVVCSQRIDRGGGIEARSVQYHAAAARQRAQAQVETVLDLRFVGETRQRVRQLREQGATDVAGADQAHRQRGRRQPERTVRGAQCAYGIGIGDRDRDVAFARALGDGANVHARPRQTFEQTR